MAVVDEEGVVLGPSARRVERLERREQPRRDALPANAGVDEKVVEQEHSLQRHRREARIELCEAERSIGGGRDEDDRFAMIEPGAQECARSGEVARPALELA